LFGIINVCIKEVVSLRISVFHRLSTILSKILSIGLSKRFESDFVEDALGTCRSLAFTKDDSTKDSLLEILLPHILPWLRKYPGETFFFHWINILKNITLDNVNTNPHKGRCLQLWFVFPPIVGAVKDSISRGLGFNSATKIRCIMFFSNLCCIPDFAVEIFKNTKYMIDNWFIMVKEQEEDKHNWGIKYWSEFISMLSTVPSLVPHISPKYDAAMAWCKDNGGWGSDYSRYFNYCYPHLKNWCELIDSIKECQDSESTSRLYHKQRGSILSIFRAYQFRSEIEEHKKEIVLCCQCLRWFFRHLISGTEIYLPITDLNDLIDTFIGHLSRVEKVLESSVDEEYCWICVNYSLKVQDRKDSFLLSILPTFQHILERGSKEKLGGDVSLWLLCTLRNISNSKFSSTRSSIFTLIKPYVKDWMRIYGDSWIFEEWFIILANLTWSSEDNSPNKRICSESWPFFHPILDVVKRECSGDKIVEGNYSYVLHFFSNLCCDPSHVHEIFVNIKYLLDGWFEAIKKKKHELGIKYWSKLISILSSDISLVPSLSLKYDEMEWCKDNSAGQSDCSMYFQMCKSYLEQKKLNKFEILINAIKKCQDSSSTSKLYHKHRQSILSVFRASMSRGEIIEHTKEIILCCQCLKWFVRHPISGIKIYLNTPTLNDLVDTFISHMSRVDKVLESVVEEEYCDICVGFTFSYPKKRDSFLPKIFPTFQHILERGSKGKLGDNAIIGVPEGNSIVPKNVLLTLNNISNSKSSSTQSSIFTLIKPYIIDWMGIYRDVGYYNIWIIILSKISWSPEDNAPNMSICSETWAIFHFILDFMKKELIGDNIVKREYCFILKFFSNLCSDRSHAIEVYENIEHLLADWFEAIKKKKHKNGIKYWSELVSVLSSIPSLVPEISPKYDSAVEWCRKKNEKGNNALMRYRENCKRYHDQKFMETLSKSIMDCSDSESTSHLYHQHRGSILSVFLSCQSESTIKEHKKELVLCFQCLSLFVRHFIPRTNIYLPIPDLNDLIDTFIDHLSRVESILEAAVDKEYCRICLGYTFKVQDKWNSFLPKISPTFHRILERGSKEKLKGNVPKWLLNALRNISRSKSSSTRSSLFTLIKPYAKDWMRIYGDIKYYERWVVILANLTWSSEDNSPNKRICSESWPFFHPILDVVKRECSGDKIVEKGYYKVLDFFSNLCCDPSHVHEIYDNIKDLLDGWYEAVKKKKHERKIKNWSKLISMLSTSPSLVPLLSPKYDTHMEWCKDNGGWREDYSRYLNNCYPYLKKWNDLINSIKKSPNSGSTSLLYLNNRESILFVFLSSQSPNENEKHKKELLLCYQCLRLFVRHNISQNDVYLPIPELNNLISIFFDHLSRVNQVLQESVEEEYCAICADYTSIVTNPSNLFLDKISTTLPCILERGSKKKLEGSIPTNLILTLKNISISKSTSIRSSIFTIIKPFIKDWLRLYRKTVHCYQQPSSFRYYGEWINILSNLTWSPEDNAPNPSICSEAWSFSPQILDFVKKECVEIDNEYFSVMHLFSNFCCDPSHAIELFENIKDLLDGWFKIHKIGIKYDDHMGIKCWTKLFSMLTAVPSLVPHISPKYDDSITFRANSGSSSSQYLSNVFSVISSSHLPFLLKSIPSISIIPPIVTLKSPSSDGYIFATHVCSGMGRVKASHEKCKIPSYYNVLTGSEIKCRCLDFGRVCYTIDEFKVKDTVSEAADEIEKDEKEKVTSDTSNPELPQTVHSSLIQYTHPQHLLVKMTFT
ncbi:hypothetical protein ADUPG1_012035, partial [Aduncisulcus paluster]